ncbi:MAG: hypothetical protein WAM79_16110 [Candidatus Sulfotelmatobacter sp.]
MATARVPIPEALYDVHIDLNGESESLGISVLSSDQVEFTNNAPFPVLIKFICANGPVFTDIQSINAGGTSSAQTPQKTEITTDYYIQNLNTKAWQGPYSIQVGINPTVVAAPLYIPIVDGAPPKTGNPNMSTVAVPQRGWVQFNLDQSYNLSWSPSNAFPVVAAPIGPGNYTYQAQTGNQNQDATYTLASVRGVTGSGTVKIRS